MQIGKITQVMGPVVDVHFDETPLPYIFKPLCRLITMAKKL